MSDGPFVRRVLGWNRKVYKLRTDVFREAFMQLVDEMQAACPKDTHFLMSTLTVSKDHTPRIKDPNPQPNAPKGTFKWDRSRIVGVVQNAEFGEKLYLGYTAKYAAIVHDGRGNNQPRPWVMLVAQRWRQIVAEARARIRARADA